jgi:hypothetical protein
LGPAGIRDSFQMAIFWVIEIGQKESLGYLNYNCMLFIDYKAGTDMHRLLPLIPAVPILSHPDCLNHPHPLSISISFLHCSILLLLLLQLKPHAYASYRVDFLAPKFPRALTARKPTKTRAMKMKMLHCQLALAFACKGQVQGS